jgi:hypothetical protein
MSQNRPSLDVFRVGAAASFLGFGDSLSLYSGGESQSALFTLKLASGAVDVFCGLRRLLSNMSAGMGSK